MTPNNMGSEGFKWFFGIVEDREDPLKLGRVKIRINTVDNTSNKQMLPTSGLPWAIPLVPIISSSQNEVGLAPVGPQVGSTVFGFFMDGAEGQRRVYMGSLFGIPDNNPKKHDVPAQARGIDTINKQIDGPEPASAFAAVYPYNKVYKSESGHVFEIDDTPNKERIHHYHKSGTYTEINAEGRRVDKIVGDGYEIVVKNKTVYIKGNLSVKVVGNVDYKVNGNMNVTVDGTYNLYAGNKNETIAGSTNIRYENTMKEYFGGNYHLRKKAGLVDLACPSDTRSSSIDCGEVPQATKIGN